MARALTASYPFSLPSIHSMPRVPFNILRLDKLDMRQQLNPHYCDKMPEKKMVFLVDREGVIHQNPVLPSFRSHPQPLRCPPTIFIQTAFLKFAKEIRKKWLVPGFLLWVEINGNGLYLMFALHKKFQDFTLFPKKPTAQRAKYDLRYFDVEERKGESDGPLEHVDQFTVDPNGIIGKLLLPSSYNIRHEMNNVSKLKLRDSRVTVEMVNEINFYIRHNHIVRYFVCFRKDSVKSVLLVEVYKPIK